MRKNNVNKITKDIKFNTYCTFTNTKYDITEAIGLAFNDFLDNENIPPEAIEIDDKNKF